MTKIVDIRAKTADELQTQLLDLRKEQFNLRFQRATGQLENTSRVRVVRRDIARIMTVAKQKRTGDEPVVKPAEPKPASSKPERVKPKRTAKARAPVKSRSKPKLKSRAKTKKSKK